MQVPVDADGFENGFDNHEGRLSFSFYHISVPDSLLLFYTIVIKLSLGTRFSGGCWIMVKLPARRPFTVPGGTNDGTRRWGF
jgi:hypothetical protein